MPISRNRKKAPLAGAFFLCLFLNWPAYATAPACSTERYDETATLASVHDGDTIRLKDGRKLRIIGINTPELARDDTPAEPFAQQARETLTQLLGREAHIKLRWGREKQDRYGRLLAHVFLADGRNVSQYLLEQGLAMALVVPPNLWQWPCYAAAEKSAQQNGRGLWTHPHYQIKNSSQLHKDTRGFHLVQGRVQRVGLSKSSIWLNLEGRFAIRIKRSDLPQFKELNVKSLKGKEVIARGWLQFHNQELRMRVRHPAALQIVR